MFESVGKWNKVLFPLLILILAVTFFKRHDFKSVNDVMPDLLKEPVQTELENVIDIKFMKDDFEYSLTPLYDYEINALVVHKMDYRWFSLNKIDNAIPLDLGLLWGSNVKDKIYQDKSIKFTQDSRFCWVRWSGNLSFNFNEWSNNHLVINKIEIEKKLKHVSTGDQIKIKGKLVNLKARYIGKSDTGGTKDIELTTSITRSDREAGACEIIYVEDIQILKKANVFYRFLFDFSFYCLVFLIILNIIRFIKSFNALY